MGAPSTVYHYPLTEMFEKGYHIWKLPKIIEQDFFSVTRITYIHTSKDSYHRGDTCLSWYVYIIT